MDLQKYGLKIGTDGKARELCAGSFGDRDAYELSTIGLRWNRNTLELEELIPGVLASMELVNVSGNKHETIDIGAIDFQKYGLKLGSDGKYRELCGGSYTKKDANELASFGLRWNREACKIERIVGVVPKAKPATKAKPKTATPSTTTKPKTGVKKPIKKS